MNGFITSTRFSRTVNLPISLAQTELRRTKEIVIAEFSLALHQKLELRELTLTVVSVLTPGVVPSLINTAMGLCSVGIYQGAAVCGPIAYTSFTAQTTSTNPFSPCIILTPNNYRVIVSNNANNVDLAVAATGMVKFSY